MKKLFRISTLPATNTKGTRVKIECIETGWKKIIPYDYGFKSALNIGGYFLLGLYPDAKVTYFMGHKKGFYILLTD